MPRRARCAPTAARWSIRIRHRISDHRTRYPKIYLLRLGLASGPKDNRPRWESGGKYRVTHVESRGLPRLFAPGGKAPAAAVAAGQDRKSVGKGKSVSVRVDLGGRRIIKKTKVRKRR